MTFEVFGRRLIMVKTQEEIELDMESSSHRKVPATPKPSCSKKTNRMMKVCKFEKSAVFHELVAELGCLYLICRPQVCRLRVFPKSIITVQWKNSVATYLGRGGKTRSVV